MKEDGFLIFSCINKGGLLLGSIFTSPIVINIGQSSVLLITV